MNVFQHNYMLTRTESIQMDEQYINTTVQARALLGSLRFCPFHCVYSVIVYYKRLIKCGYVHMLVVIYLL